MHFVDKKRKRELLSQMIGQGNWRQVLVFTRTKHGANHLAEQLNKDGIRSAAIHGNKSQARVPALADFRLATYACWWQPDIAARGLDIEELPHVVNYELPNVPEDYVHRIGRTGRAAATGEALSLVCVDEHKLLRDIERLLKKEIPRIETLAMKLTRQSKPSQFRTVVRVAGAVRAAVVAVSSRVVPKAARRNLRANRRVVITTANRPVKTHGVAAKGNRQARGSADAARVSLLTRSNLEARS
ncbi:helicase-related protein [Enterobacter hormaechei]